MKIILKAFIVLVAGFVLPARAGYLLTIDVTDPSAVVFTGTSENVTNTDVKSYTAGVNLVNFFTASTGGAGAINYDPVPTLANALNTNVSYVVWESDRYISGSYVNVHLYHPFSNAGQFFISGQPAFTGTSYLNLSGYGLPAYGAHGPIYVGNSFDHGNGIPIGEWKVVGPVPPAPPLADPTILSPSRISSTQFAFSVNGTNGANYTVQYSTNLASTNWITLTSFLLTTNPFPVMDTNATTSERYYRVLKN